MSYEKSSKSGFSLLAICSIIIILNVIFVPICNAPGRLIPENIGKFIVFEKLLDSSKSNSWIVIFSFSALIPAFVLLFSSAIKSKILSILSSVGGVALLIYNLNKYISQNELSHVINFNGNYMFFSIGFWIALFLFIICFFRAITIRKKTRLSNTYYFNGKEYLRITDENEYLELAYKGRVDAQHGLGIFYMQKQNMDKALYWFCVAEYNGYGQATSDLNCILSGYPDPESLNKRIMYYREEVNKNPVYKETFEDILKEMANDPDLRR